MFQAIGIGYAKISEARGSVVTVADRKLAENIWSLVSETREAGR